MPKYLKDVNHLISKEEIQLMINNCTNPRDQALIAFLYLTGARPCEASEIRGKHFNPYAPNKTNHFELNVYTAKRSRKTGYNPDRRTLHISRDAPFANLLIKHFTTIHDEERAFQIGGIRIRQIVWKASENIRPPYAFRHNRMYKICLDNPSITLPELMAWKGATDVRSVSAYLAHKPIYRELSIT